MRVFVALVVLAAAELTVLVLVGQQIGILGLIGVLLGAALLGGWAIRHEGRRSMRALMEAVRSGRPADAEVVDGMLVAAAGLLLLLPGLIGDVIALVLLLPPVRRAVGRRITASAAARPRVVTVAPGVGWAPRPDAAGTRAFRGTVIEGTVVDERG